MADPELEDRRKVIAWTRLQEYVSLPKGQQWPVRDEKEEALPEECYEAVELGRRMAREEEELRLAKVAQIDSDEKAELGRVPYNPDPAAGLTLLEMQEHMTAWVHGKGRELKAESMKQEDKDKPPKRLREL